MTLNQKINKINELCKNSLRFIYYSATGWEISSYAEATTFSIGSKLYKEKRGYLDNKDFTALVGEAYELITKKYE